MRLARLIPGLSLCFVYIGIHLCWSDIYTYNLYSINSSHSIIDPHQLFSSQTSLRFTPELSGLHVILKTLGFRSTLDLSYSTFLPTILIVLYILVRYYIYINIPNVSLTTLGSFSILWSGHLIHISIPSSIGNLPSLKHLTLTGGIFIQSSSIPLGDICHHHLALGIILILLDKLSANIPISNLRYLPISSIHIRISITLILLSSLSALTSQQLSTLPSYPSIPYIYISNTTLYVHHIWISSLLLTGSISHIGIYMTYNGPSANLLRTLILHKSAIISTLSWIALFLGFHTLAHELSQDLERLQAALQELDNMGWLTGRL